MGLGGTRSTTPFGYTLSDMTEAPTSRIAVEFTIPEAKLVVAALRQFEPFWPHDMDDMGRAELLAGIRHVIERLASELDPDKAPTT